MEIDRNDEIPEGKCICSVCKTEKDNTEFSFYTNRHTKDGNRLRVNTNCRTCSTKIRKESAQLRKPYEHLHPKPGTPCSCCEQVPANGKYEFDHCHLTGAFRGFVCKDCNVGFGKFGDNASGILKAWKYLMKTYPNSQEKNNLLKEMIDESTTLLQDSNVG